MAATLEARISAFNRQALQWQEEAYTLAYYLLGNKETASQAVEQAFLQAFDQSREIPGKLRLLRLVLACCKAFVSSVRLASRHDPILSLPLNERQVILLVDVLGLSYSEAALVIGTSTGRVSQWLASGRLMAAGQGIGALAAD